MKKMISFANTPIKTLVTAVGMAFIVCVLSLVFAGSAFAQDTPTTPGASASTPVPFTHTVKASDAVDMSGITYTISATPTDLTENPSLVTTSVRTVPAAVVSAKSDIVITPATDASSGSATEKVFSSSQTLAQLFGDADNFAAPGFFLFDISETAAGGTSADTSLWTNDSKTYRLEVRVINAAGSEDHLAYSWWTLTDLSSSEKVPTVSFTSAYQGWRDLTISERVMGDYGNRLYDFPYKVTFYLPGWYDPNTKAVATPTGASVETAFAQATDADPWVGAYTFTLRHNQEIVFNVPVGTYYKIEEFPGAATWEDAKGVLYDIFIEWNVSQSSSGGVVPTIPDSLSDASLGELQAISAGLRNSTVQPSAVSNLIGETMTATLGDGSSATVRLVDASADKGLVFMFDYTEPLGRAVMNDASTNAGGWAVCSMRTNLNSADVPDGIYATKLQGMQIAGEPVAPVGAALSSLDYNGGEPQVIETTGDKFWLASGVEIYGSDAWALLDLGYTGTENGTQFAYFAYLDPNPLDFDTNPLAESPATWFLRSASPYEGNTFAGVGDDGELGIGADAHSEFCVVPCFCL